MGNGERNERAGRNEEAETERKNKRGERNGVAEKHFSRLYAVRAVAKKYQKSFGPGPMEVGTQTTDHTHANSRPNNRTLLLKRTSLCRCSYIFNLDICARLSRG